MQAPAGLTGKRRERAAGQPAPDSGRVFGEALTAILGENAAGLSPTNIVRLKQGWEQEYKEWSRRDFSNKRYVCFWADGIYFNVGLERDRPCMLVIIGTAENGTKELVAVYHGHRESKESWLEVLRDLKRRGLKKGPQLAVGDGPLGFWGALEEVFPEFTWMTLPWPRLRAIFRYVEITTSDFRLPML